MSFWKNMKARLDSAMRGRYGADTLGKALLMAGLAFAVLEIWTGAGVWMLLAFAAYAWALFRALSRDIQKRQREDEAFRTLCEKAATKARQWLNRVKHGREYRYFKCPQCKAPLRLKRRVGNVTVTCKKCGHRFEMKA